MDKNITELGNTVKEKFGTEPLFSERLAGYTSFGIGGECDLLLKPESAECIRYVRGFCRGNNIPLHILGRGSNVLISDKGVRGVFLVIGSGLSDMTVSGNTIKCGAGAPLIKLCGFAAGQGLSGLEFAYGIPGTVGGGLYMNAGAYGGEMKDVVLECEILDREGDIRTLDREQMKLSYRSSVFSSLDAVILSVTFGLAPGDPAAVKEKMNELLRKRRSSQPLEYPSAGSTFKRPAGGFAAKLIEDSGLKGCTVGGAQVSEKHSGFVINRDNASFDDVIGLVEHIKKKVKEDSGISLECEMLIIE